MMGYLLTLSLFILPGIFLLFKKDFFPRLLSIEKFPLVIALSLAYWIIGFWFLKFIPIPLHLFITISLGFSGSVFLITIIHKFRRWRIPRAALGKNLLIALWFILLAIPAISLASYSVAPSGADMSMHAYLARIIYLSDAFPKTPLSLVPMDRFGDYPIGFPILVADMMLVNKFPVQTNALWLSAFTYWFFAASLYTLIRSKFPRFVSAMATVLTAWVSLTPNDFIEWGANPTILSLNFLIVGGIFFLCDKNKWSFFFLFVSLYTALLIHYIVPAGFGYIGLLLLPFMWKRIMRNMRPHETLLPTLAGCTVLILPFIIHIFTGTWGVSSAAQSFVANLHTQELQEWAGPFSSVSFIRAVYFLINTFGLPISILYAIGLTVLVAMRWRSALLHGIFLLGIIGLVINAEYWLLPFSPILYPKRIALLLTIPISLAIAEGFFLGIHVMYTHFVIHSIKNRLILYVLIALFAGYIYYPGILTNLRRFINSAHLSVVTEKDIEALGWLAQNTSRDTVILNNYMDAGIWIPAIADRPITLYHTNPIDMNHAGRNTGRETYAYIGSRTLTGLPEVDPVNSEDLQSDPTRYTLVYTNGRAQIYRIVPAE